MKKNGDNEQKTKKKLSNPKIIQKKKKMADYSEEGRREWLSPENIKKRDDFCKWMNEYDKKPILPFPIDSHTKPKKIDRKEQVRLAVQRYRKKKREEDINAFNKHEREVKYAWRERTGIH